MAYLRCYADASVDDVLDMTFDEYAIKMDAYNLRMVDKERDMHWSAFLNHAVTATKESRDGKSHEPRYKTFAEFFDYNGLLQAVSGEEDEEEKEAKMIQDKIEQERKEKSERLKQLMLRANRQGGEGIE